MYELKIKSSRKEKKKQKQHDLSLLIHFARGPDFFFFFLIKDSEASQRRLEVSLISFIPSHPTYEPQGSVNSQLAELSSEIRP